MRSLLLFIFGVSMLTTTGLAVHAPLAFAKSDVEILNVVQAEKQSTVTRLANGLTVMVLEDNRFPLVSTRLYVHAGSAYEKPAQAGISHVLEHMVFKGTKKRPKGGISQEVEAAGGYLNAATSFDYTVYMTDIPSRHWKLGMDIVSDMAFHATLDADELASEKKVILAELQRSKDSPHSRMFEAALVSSLKGTPYGRPIIGYEDTIKAISVKDMQDYIAEYYQPQNMLLVVVGNIVPEKVIAEAKRVFNSYENTHALPEPKPINIQNLDTKSTIIVQPGPWNKVYFAAAIPVPDMADYQSSTLDVLAHLLGGDNTSLFVRTYKYDRQLVDSIAVMNMGLERLGVFLITAELDAANVQEFWDSLTKDLANLKTTSFTDAELKRAKVNLEDGFFRSKETLAGLASKLGQFQFFMGGEQGEKNTIEALRSVNKNMLRNAITTWIRPDRLTAVMLPPADYKAKNLEAMLETNWPVPKQTQAKLVTVNTGLETLDLGNGRKLILLPDATLPYVSLSLLYSGGDVLATPEQQGLAALTARMLTKGTKGKNAQALEAYFADRAISLIASAGQQTFAISASGPTRFQKDLFTGLRDLLVNSVFDKKEFERGQKTQAALIRSREDKALSLAFRQIPSFLFADSVYGYKRLGDIDTIMKYTPKMSKDFWAKQGAMPWVLAVAGDFDKDMLIRFVKSMPAATEKKAVMPEAKWSTKEQLDIEMEGRKQAHLMLLFKTVPDSSPDAPGLNVLQSVLSGMSGILFKDLRDEKGLGYTVTAFNQHTPDFGYMAFYMGTEPDTISQARTGFLEAIDRLKTETLPNEDLERGKNQLEGDYYRALQSLGSRANEAAGLTLRGLPLDFMKQQLDASRKVTAKSLRELAQKYFIVPKAYTVEITPKS